MGFRGHVSMSQYTTSFYCYCFSKKDVIIAYFTHQLKSCQRISLGLSVALFWLGNCQKISSRKRHAPMCDPFFHMLLCHRAYSKDFISIILVSWAHVIIFVRWLKIAEAEDRLGIVLQRLQHRFLDVLLFTTQERVNFLTSLPFSWEMA